MNYNKHRKRCSIRFDPILFCFVHRFSHVNYKQFHTHLFFPIWISAQFKHTCKALNQRIYANGNDYDEDKVIELVISVGRYQLNTDRIYFDIIVFFIVVVVVVVKSCNWSCRLRKNGMNAKLFRQIVRAVYACDMPQSLPHPVTSKSYNTISTRSLDDLFRIGGEWFNSHVCT